MSEHPLSANAADRAAGCIVGAFIGDALGVGPHWYYDVDELRRDFGPWITGYTAPKPGRYHDGLTPGELSQTGIIMKMLLRSVAERGAAHAAASALTTPPLVRPRYGYNRRPLLAADD